jgi:hypothetical protein
VDGKSVNKGVIMIKVCAANVVFTFKKCDKAIYKDGAVTVYDKGGTKVALFETFDWAHRDY